KMIKMKKKSNRYGFIYSLFFILMLLGCDEYQTCIKSVEFNTYPISGTVVIDTLYTKFNFQGVYKAVSKDRKDTLDLEYYNAFPRTPQKGDSVVKILNDGNYTFYTKDSFFVMGLDCRIKRVVTFEKGLIDTIKAIQEEEDKME